MIDEDQLQRHSRQARDYTRALIDQFDGRLAQTRLIFASFDAEEAGLRGSRAYVRAHRAELAALPTCNLNIDSIYTAEFTMAGVRATTMLAMPTGIVRDGLVYHTMRDTIDAVQPEAAAACLFVAAHWVQERDSVKDQVQG